MSTKKLTKGQRRAKGNQNARKHDKYVRNRPQRLLKRKNELKLIKYKIEKKQMEEINKLIRGDKKIKEEGGFINK